MKYMVTARIFIFWMVHDKKKQVFASTCVSQNDLMKKMPVCGTYLYSYSVKTKHCVGYKKLSVARFKAGFPLDEFVRTRQQSLEFPPKFLPWK
jgi:hypothetical protein